MADRIDPHPGEILFDPACGTGGFLTCAIRHMEKNYVRTPKQRKKMQARAAGCGRRTSAAP
jgi:type I restriction enzyme M protein